MRVPILNNVNGHRNLKCLASPVAKMIGPKVKNKSCDHSQREGVICHPRLTFDTAYLYTIFENCSFSHSRHIKEDPKRINVGDLVLLEVICNVTT